MVRVEAFDAAVEGARGGITLAATILRGKSVSRSVSRSVGQSVRQAGRHAGRQVMTLRRSRDAHRISSSRAVQDGS